MFIDLWVLEVAMPKVQQDWHYLLRRNTFLNKIGNSPSMANPAGDIVPTEKSGWLVERKGKTVAVG